jgi:acyl-coenzyme A synthetase/AMP-(fatty) acid ligase
VVVTALPKTGLGKIAKHELRAQLTAAEARTTG